jgi:alpha-galactosidase
VTARRVALRGALALAGALLAAAALAAPAGARSSKVLAATPYMGWDTYFAFGPKYNEATILEQASNLITSGLQKDGYKLIWLDVGWWQGHRNNSGEITVNPAQWPHGMAWLAQTLHAEGFKVGLYTDAGINGCGGLNEGMYGHYQQDINTFARWGFDAVKVDFCGGDDLHLTPKTAYTKIHDAIVNNSSHHPMLLDICVFPQPGQVGNGFPSFPNSSFTSYIFGPSVGNSWRTDTDVGSPTGITWNAVVRNLDADATEPLAAGPGHWNDPDYLGPQLGMTAPEAQAQMTMWAIVAAPLILGSDPRKLSNATLRMLENPRVLAVDQDRLGIQGTEISARGSGQVWVKPLTGSRRAVALLNTGPRWLTITTSAAAIRIARATGYRVQNLWNGRRSVGHGTITARVAPHSVLLYDVSD